MRQMNTVEIMQKEIMRGNLNLKTRRSTGTALIGGEEAKITGKRNGILVTKMNLVKIVQVGTEEGILVQKKDENNAEVKVKPEN
jgi:hypothetical protein